MEYFDFDEASYGSNVREDDVASDNLEFDENEAAENYNAIFQEQSLEFPNDNDLPEQDAGELDNGVYPMSRAEEPCDFCRHMNLDCFVAKSGVMRPNGCTCCISLYRECSFTHARAPGKFLDTLHPISENTYIHTGGLTGKKALKSLSFIAEDDGRARKSKSRLAREAVRILKAWLQEHWEHPYPTEQEKDELQQRTGLKRMQISNWLANARRRGKVPPGPRNSSATGAINIPGQKGVDVTYMTPIERWKHSPPENEPAATSDILRALVTTDLKHDRQRASRPGHVRSLSRKTGSSNDSSHANSNLFHAPSVSSQETSQSATRSSISDLSFASAFSHRSSLGSFGSMERKERRRRRKPSLPVNTFNQQKARNARIYQCTFCTDCFQTKYDWQRHEKSLHLALEKWTCSPLGGVAFIDDANRCVFCMAVDPNDDHLESHNYSICQEKTPAERSFYRKDHLNQHLRLMHNVKFNSSMNAWRSTLTEFKSRCGFCGLSLTTWKDRVDHLASHFKNGSTMAQWQGDWGFEPFIQGLVENAMPPYLIGGEQKTLNPSRPPNAAQSTNLLQPEDANCYRRLQRELTAYIHNQRAAGTIPTDRMIQDEGRRIIYGSDDPWNQTCADNSTWLSLLKRDTGLEVLPGSEHIQLSDLGMRPPFAAADGLRQAPAETSMLSSPLYPRQGTFSPVTPNSGLQSPAFMGHGRSSFAASAPGSSTGSYAESSGFLPSRPYSRLSADVGSTLSAGIASLNTPLSGSVDQFVQMGFDPEFLQQLNERYDELPLDDLQGLCFEESSRRESEVGARNVGQHQVEPTGKALPFSTPVSAPITIPGMRSSDVFVSDTGPNEELAPTTDLGYSGMHEGREQI
ncbi:putative homeobox and C2H2 transcription factor [Aspergillus neoniger CBS 115656]|uniref:Homeobox and C2H2 transcription factor n=1 Tax=Aspergillus neoniger (strain CBS 115656) TaxID=1448310 RepID=A0A318YX73_ASPNB|nr:homeobox and C2H2 transcription factor [Aspergillus neoniger CBS 115656]PYH39505.1 homeobox and C2H2 transcription factor [Aspergillus neoniger CBS 115656]